MTILLFLALLPFAISGAWLILAVIGSVFETLFESTTFAVLLGLGLLMWFFSSGVWIPWIYG